MHGSPVCVCLLSHSDAFSAARSQSPTPSFDSTHKTNAADLSRGVFAILISVIRRKKIYNLLPLHRFHLKLANRKQRTVLPLLIVDDSIVDAISFTRLTVLSSKNTFFQNATLALDPAGFEFLFWPNLAPAGFEIVKFSTALM